MPLPANGPGSIRRPKPLETQISGEHYKGFKIQPIVYAHENKLGPCEANIVKYASRHKLKGGADDLRKAIHYCELLLQLEYNETK